MLDITKEFSEMRRIGTPFVMVLTPDYRATMTKLMGVTYVKNGKETVSPPCVMWDMVRGHKPLTKDAGAELLGEGDSTVDAPSFLLSTAVERLKNDSILFMVFSENSVLNDPKVAQGIANVRESFKASGRTLVILGRDLTLPTLVVEDVPILREELPSDARLEQLATQTHSWAGCGDIAPEDAKKAAGAVRGLTEFAAEEGLTRNLRRDNGKAWFDIDSLTRIRQEVIESSTGGALTFERGKESFADIGGLSQIKNFATRLFEGREPPQVIVRIEEIEKAMAGSNSVLGDNTGVSQDQLGVLLREMEDNNWTGMIAVGLPGCLHADTPIYDPVDGTTISVRRRFIIGKPFHVYSVGDNGVTVAVACSPTKFIKSRMFKVEFDSGESVTVTAGHRFFDGYQYVSTDVLISRLQECEPCRLPTILGIDRLSQRRDVRHLMQKAVNSQESCLMSCHQDDVQLLIEADNGQSVFQQQGDVQRRTHELNSGGLVDKYKHISCRYHQQSDDHLSMSHFDGQGDCAGFGESRRQQTPRLREPAQRCFQLHMQSRKEARQMHTLQQLPRCDLLSKIACGLVVAVACSLAYAARSVKRCIDWCGIFWQFVFESCRFRSLSASRVDSTTQKQEPLVQSERLFSNTFPLLCWLRHAFWPQQSQKVLNYSQRWHRQYSRKSPYNPWASNSNYNGSVRVVNIHEVDSDCYYDFHVPGYENYWACGVFHHNSGKSLCAKAIGNTFKVPTLNFDLGCLKFSAVGESEAAVRRCMGIIKSFAGQRAFFVATSNKLDVIPPELRRRFRCGIWAFDLPSSLERNAIWKINLKKYGLEGYTLWPDDTDYTGADIRNVCETAWRLKTNLIEASGFIVPVAKSDPQAVVRFRVGAEGKFLSASRPGFYTSNHREQERQVSL